MGYPGRRKGIDVGTCQVPAPSECGFLMLGLEVPMLILSDPPPWPQPIGPETRDLAQARPIRLPLPPVLSPESF